MSWEVVIGLEIHTQLATHSKIFSGASTAFGAEPNTQACAVDLGLPGVLPVLNKAAVEMAVKFGVATGSEIAARSVFARKNYFYPDLPKGYQISQFELPIVGKGQVEIQLEDGSLKTINITRAHLEEDAGKSLHEDFHDMTGIDLNRAGTPLLEIVSEPDMRSAKEAVAYAKKIHALVRYLEICDGNMQEGSFRCDANVSIRKQGDDKLGTRTELKNINSFRFLERGINYEVERQIELVESGGVVQQQTRLYDADKNETRAMRSKEEANDYRYFPDPDLLPVELDAEFIATIKKQLPELPEAKTQRFVEQYGLPSEEVRALTVDRDTADYFEVVMAGGKKITAKLAANWIAGELSAYLNKTELGIKDAPVSAEQLGQLLLRISDNTLSNKLGREVFDALWQGEANVDQIIEKRGLKQITDSGEIEQIVDTIIAANAGQVEQYRSGKDKVFGFFVGQVMKATQGKANPEQVNQLLKQKLNP